jgi:hypothetical protein
MPGFHADRPPRNKGLRYPADPPTVEEIVAACGSPATVCTAGACAGWSSCYAAPVFA